jgi:DUF1365 family protein
MSGANTFDAHSANAHPAAMNSAGAATNASETNGSDAAGRTAPVIYDAVLTHIRRERIHREFRHRLYLWLVDLDALPELPRWLRPFAGFRSGDHLGDPDRDIRRNLDAWLAEQGIHLHGGQVLMLTQASVLGHVFNPITLYWCHYPAGQPACVVAEVHNTYRERHRYLLRPDTAGRARVAKDFYVSPFLAGHGQYLMRVPRPDERLSITVALLQRGDTTLSATLRGSRRPATPAALVRLLLTRPLMPHRVSALIRRHGIALWLRRVPIVPRTPRPSQEDPDD